MSAAALAEPSRGARLLRTTALMCVAVVMLYPLLWLIGASFKTNAQIFTEAGFWPDRFSFDAYVKDLRTRYERVVVRKPAASRRRSNEVYALALGKRRGKN